MRMSPWPLTARRRGPPGERDQDPGLSRVKPVLRTPWQFHFRPARMPRPASRPDTFPIWSLPEHRQLSFAPTACALPSLSRRGVFSPAGDLHPVAGALPVLGEKPPLDEKEMVG